MFAFKKKNWLKTNELIKDFTSCREKLTAFTVCIVRRFAYQCLCCSSFPDHFTPRSPLRVAVCESCLDFYRNWSGRFLGEISARKWKAICIKFIFLCLGVFPQGTDEPVSLFRRSLELREYATMSHVKCWKMSEDNGSSAEDTPHSNV